MCRLLCRTVAGVSAILGCFDLLDAPQQDLEALDVALIGVPMDLGVSTAQVRGWDRARFVMWNGLACNNHVATGAADAPQVC